MIQDRDATERDLRAELERVKQTCAEHARQIRVATFELRAAINHRLADDCDDLPSLARMAKGTIEQSRGNIGRSFAHIPDRYNTVSGSLNANGQWIKLEEIRRLNPHLTFRDDGLNQP